MIERDGVRVFVDTKSHELLAGTTIDFVVALEGSGFTFENPNAKSSCSLRKVVRLTPRVATAIQPQLWKEVARPCWLSPNSRDHCRTRETERDDIIKAVIEEIRPNLRRDGGDCQLIEIDGNKVMVKLTGACVFCKLSSATLEGIQARIVERLGELVRLIPVAGRAE